MRRPIAVVLAALAVWGCTARAQPLNGAIRIDSVAAPMDPGDPADVRRGAFTYAGGVQLRGVDSAQLGGLSDLRVTAAGDFLAVSDDGQWLEARVVLDADGRLQGLADARMRPLVGADGQPVQGKHEGDAEGLAIWPNGDRMVSFERHHRILLYPAAGGPPRSLPIPTVAMPDNTGMEALAIAPNRGPDAYWVGLEQGSIWLCRVDGGCVEEQGEVRPPFAHRLTALAQTPDGDLVVLHHGWDPLRGSHGLIWITRPNPGGRARVLAKLALARPLTVDNFEGVAVQPLAGGGIRLFLITDDNFAPTQRNLLLAFDWRSAAAKTGRARVSPPQARSRPAPR